MEANADPTSTLTAVLVSPADAATPARGEWRTWSLVVLSLLAFYALLWNPHWVPGGDSDFYLAAARNLALGRGYTWNGTPVGIAPPGWPLVLAGALKISTAFGFLKLIPILCMTAFWGVSYWILRRFAPPKRVAMVILLCGNISHVYSLTFWLHSDALFCLLCGTAILLAMQINEGRAIAWRIPVLLALCAASVAVRWLGVANWLLVAGALLRGRPIFTWNWRELRGRFIERRWVTLALAGMVTTGAFWELRTGTRATAADNREMQEIVSEESKPYDLVPSNVHGESRKKQIRVATVQFLGAGKWFSWLFWQPFRFGSASTALDVAASLVGALIGAIVLLTALRAIRRKEWIWPALAIYCAGLCFGWPNTNARYLVPLLPLLVLAVLDGIARLSPASSGSRRRRGVAILGTLFVASVVICNVALWAVDVWVAHASDFYARYEGGTNQDLIAAAHYLGQMQIHDDKIAVSSKYVNLNRAHSSHYGLRVMVLLSNHQIRDVDEKHSLQPGAGQDTDKSLMRWCWGRDVEYYVYEPPVHPWRVWHFRVPAWLEDRLARDLPPPEFSSDGAGWQLWKVTLNTRGASMTRIPLEPLRNWPDRMPGM